MNKYTSWDQNLHTLNDIAEWSTRIWLGHINRNTQRGRWDRQNARERLEELKSAHPALYAWQKIEVTQEEREELKRLTDIKINEKLSEIAMYEDQYSTKALTAKEKRRQKYLKLKEEFENEEGE